MLFDDAVMCVALDRLDLFGRNSDVLEKYDEYKKVLAGNGININDVIRNKMNGASAKWMRNEFPYDVKGTEHYLVWSTKPLVINVVQNIARKRVGGREILCFVNPDNLQSVKDVWHAHVLVNME
jgi:hypothetical protein